MYYFHVSEANLIKAYETGISGWHFTTDAALTHTCTYTQNTNTQTRLPRLWQSNPAKKG